MEESYTAVNARLISQDMGNHFVEVVGNLSSLILLTLPPLGRGVDVKKNHASGNPNKSIAVAQ